MFDNSDPSRRLGSVPLDTALTARGLEAAAELVGLTSRCERANHKANSTLTINRVSSGQGP